MKQVTGNQQLTVLDDISDEVLDAATAPARAWYRMADAGETVHTYRYFKMYLAMELPRSIGRLAVHLRMHRSGLARLSHTYKWLDRAAAHDDYMAGKQLERQKKQAEIRDMEWIARRDIQKEQEWQLAQDMLDKVRQMLAVPIFAERVEEMLEGLDPTGRIIVRQIVHIEPLDWSAVDIARYFEVAAKIARLATGMDTDQKKIRIDVSALTDAELEQLASQT
jgi:hypothetical protein